MIFLFSILSASRLQILNEERSFLSWMRSNSQFYIGDEYHFRLGIFIANQRYVNEYNRKANLKFRLGMNKLSCYTPSEYRTLLGHIDKPHPASAQVVKSNKDPLTLPDSVNWIEKGAVNEIRDQGQCGSCWAFAAIAACESVYQIESGNLLQFSEQNLVDCVPDSAGCNGGNGFTAFEYIRDKQDHKFALRDDYPYTATTETCKWESVASKGAGYIKSYIFVIPHSEVDLKIKVADWGVVDSAIDASASAFQLYSGGIYTDTACSSYFRNHEVGVVGYGTEDGTEYWLVRNSWGTSWGEAGYFRILRGTFTNLCGIASDAYIPYTRLI